MFWGLLLEPGKRYTKVVDNTFHISAAVLDTSASDKDIVRVLVEVDEVETLIANLSIKHGILQCPLDLSFEVGSQVAFYTSGAKLPVHLSGYVIIDDEVLDDRDDDDECASSEEDIPELVDPANLKRKQDDLSPVTAKKSKVMSFTQEKPQTGVVNGKVKKDELRNVIMKEDLVDADGDEEECDMDVVEEEDDEELDEEDDYDDDDDEEDTMTLKAALVKQSITPASTPKVNKAKGAVTTPLVKKMKVQQQTPKSEKKLSQQNTPMEKAKLKTPKSEGKPASQTPKNEQKIKPTTPKNEQKIKKSEQKMKSTPKNEQKMKSTPKNEQLKPTTPKNEQVTPKGQNSGKQGKKSPKHEKTINGKTPQKDTPQKIADKSQGTPKPTKVVKQGGVTCEDLVVGSGPDAKRGKMVSVYYEGRLVSSNKMFDKCDSGRGFKFRLGQGEVITGWDVGVAGMKVGGKRRIICPPNMAYGKTGAPPAIPPHSTLMFVVELKAIS